MCEETGVLSLSVLENSHFVALTMQGRFEILALTGSYTVSDNGGMKSRSGGLSVSLAGPDGRVIGGGIAGSLTAASPIQVSPAMCLLSQPCLLSVHLCSTRETGYDRIISLQFQICFMMRHVVQYNLLKRKGRKVTRNMVILFNKFIFLCKFISIA